MGDQKVMAINTGELPEVKGRSSYWQEPVKEPHLGSSQSVHSSASKPQGPQERAPRNEGE
jgi:hypothetical protein